MTAVKACAAEKDWPCTAVYTTNVMTVKHTTPMLAVDYKEREGAASPVAKAGVHMKIAVFTADTYITSYTHARDQHEHSGSGEGPSFTMASLRSCESSRDRIWAIALAKLSSQPYILIVLMPAPHAVATVSEEGGMYVHGGVSVRYPAVSRW